MRSSLGNVLLVVAPGALCGSAYAAGAVTFGRDVWALGILAGILFAGLSFFGWVAAARTNAVQAALALGGHGAHQLHGDGGEALGDVLALKVGGQGAEDPRTNELAQSKRGTDVLLESVGQGLALVDAEDAIGPQYSRALETIFEREALAGQDFLKLFEGLIPAGDYDATRRFMALFFNPAKNEHLVQQLNPLDEIDLVFPLEEGGFKTKTISATFRRIMHDGKVVQAFVAIGDVTERTAAARELRRTHDAEHFSK